MNRFLATLPLLIMATPLLAHSDAHIHPHADDPSWILIIVGALSVMAVVTFVWKRK